MNLDLRALATTIARLLIQPSAGSGLPVAPNRTQSLADARARLRAFAASGASSMFTLVNPANDAAKFAVRRAEFVKRMMDLVANPRLLDQGNVNACGMAAFLHLWLKRAPDDVAKFAIDLFQHGRAAIGSLDVVPNQDLLKQNYALLPTGAPPVADWIMVSGLRNGTGRPGFLGRHDDAADGIVFPQELQEWLEATTLYSAVANHANFFEHQTFNDVPIFPDVTRDVAMLLNTKMLAKNLDKPTCGCDQASKDVSDITLAQTVEEVTAPVLPNHYVIVDAIKEKADHSISVTFWCWSEFLEKEPILLSDGKTPCTCMPYVIERSLFDANFYGVVMAVA